MKIAFSDRAVESLNDAPPAVRTAFSKQIRFLVGNLHHPSLRAKKYDEGRNLWQARVNRSWRFYFTIVEDVYQIEDVILTRSERSGPRPRDERSRVQDHRVSLERRPDELEATRATAVPPHRWRQLRSHFGRLGLLGQNATTQGVERRSKRLLALPIRPARTAGFPLHPQSNRGSFEYQTSTHQSSTVYGIGRKSQRTLHEKPSPCCSSARLLGERGNGTGVLPYAKPPVRDVHPGWENVLRDHGHALAIYQGSNFTLTGSVSLPDGATATCLTTTSTKAVVGLTWGSNNVNTTLPAYMTIDQATLRTSLGHLVATGYDGSNEYQIVLTGGGCSALSDDSVLFGSSLNSNFGGPQGFPKIALVAYLTVDKAVYGSTNTSFAADGLFCAPNTTLCLVLYDDPTGQPDWFEVVDTSNITQKLQPVSLGFAATSSPVFANGNVYLAPSGQE